MPVTLEGQTYYHINETCKLVGISRSTLLRWINKGSIKDATYLDRRGWRLFSEAELKSIAREAARVERNE